MKTEKSFTLVFILALVAKFFNLPGHSLLLILSLMVLSLMYFPFGFYFFSDKQIKQQNILVSVLGGMVLSIITLGILFKLMRWPSYQIQLFTTLYLTPALLFSLIYINKKSSIEFKTFYKNFITRTVFWFIMTVFFYFISTTTIIKIQYRNDPELVRLKIKSLENPENNEIHEAIENYHRVKDSIDFVNEQK